MDIRKIIKEEVERVISEGKGMAFGTGGLFFSAPTRFNSLKWKLTDKQKFYLDEICSIDPETITEADYKDASLRLGIPETNIKSIINTYTTYKPGDTYGGNPYLPPSKKVGESEESKKSRLTIGNKPATAIDIGLSVKDSRLPDFKYPKGRLMHTNPPTMSPLEKSNKYEADFKNRTWYREGEGKEHPSKIRERYYEDLNTSIMMYLFCESNPKDIYLRHDDKIVLHFDAIVEENAFNKLNGGTNYEDEKHLFIKNLIKEFNKKFDCSYVVCDNINDDKGVKIFIEHDVTKKIDMSQDSMAMMKKFLIPKIMTGHKILTNDPSVASLLGLDAGDTTWLYGPVGEKLKSGILSRNHQK